MSKLLKYALGIDGSKDKLNVCFLNHDTQQQSKVKAQHKFANTALGFKELVNWISKHKKEELPLTILMEATGVYYEKLAIYLVERGFKVSVVLPNKAKKYMQALGFKSKNDKIDAKGLAMMSAQMCLPVWQPISKYYYELRLLTRHHQSLQESKTVVTNQLHALGHSAYSSKEVEKQLKKTLLLIEKQIEQTKKAVGEHIKANKEVERKIGQVTLIKGIDVLTVATVIAESNGFSLFDNAAQLVSYAGYDVVENQSGKKAGKTTISKKGNSRIRRILHMPALNVVRYKQQPFHPLYERIFERTRIKMKAYVAVQKKLLVLIYTLWKKDQAYDPCFYTSGIEEHVPFFPFNNAEIALSVPENEPIKQVVPPCGSTTQDGHRSIVSREALFPLSQI